MAHASTQITLPFQGPYRLKDRNDAIELIADTSGIYLWCVEFAENSYRVHYVGEAASIRNRTYKHIAEQLKGNYHAYSSTKLKQNVKILVHRAGKGVVSGFEGISPQEANEQYLDCLSLFYASLPEHADKKARCRYETAIAHVVEDYGQNILAIGRLNIWRGETKPVQIDTGGCHIEALTGQTINV